MSRLATLSIERDRDASQLPRYSLLSESRWTVVLSIALATVDNFADPDLWMHVLNGLTILRTGHIPRYDTYSYSAAGMPWHNHEWLAQVALAFCYAHLGVIGLKLLKLLCATITILALAKGISATGASRRVQRLTLIITAAALAPQMQFRPQLFTFVMLSIVMTSIAVEVYRGRAILWPLIPIFALWANLHGGYTIGLGALIVAAAVLFLQGRGDTGRMISARRLAMVTLGCAAATLLNPFGVRMWINVAHSVSNPLIRQLVADWIPLPIMLLHLWRESGLQILQDVAPLFLFAGFIAAIVMAPDLADAALIAVATIFIGAAFYAERNVALAVIALAIPLARHATLALEPTAALGVGDDRGSAEPPRLAPGRGEPPAAMLAILALAVALVGGIFSNRLKTWEPTPTGAVAFMQRHDLHGNILNQFEWGEYLIWRMSDRSKVFIDGRTELVYPDRVLRQYALFFFGMEGAQNLLDDPAHDFVLIGPHNKGYQVVSRDRRWHLLYNDPTAALFARAAIPTETPTDSASSNAASTYFP